jgi:glycolate oxidase
VTEQATLDRLRRVVGDRHVLAGEAIQEDYTHDESLTVEPAIPMAVVLPATTAEVARLLELAQELALPVVARGSGTGLSGACVPIPAGIVVAFDRMDEILEVDTDNHVAVVQPGVTLQALDVALAPSGLVFPIFPGEASASVGGNVATNAGGMQAIRYGVTRQRVLGLELVLAGGQVLRTGGKFVKSSAGYDLTQLIVGSEGTLALVTEVTVKLEPRLAHRATLLAPFATLAEVTAAVPIVMSSGVAPFILEYLDQVTMASVTKSAGLDLGIPAHVAESALAYLVVALDSTHAERLDQDVEATGERLSEMGALDVYILPPHAGADLIAARERAFYAARAAGADDIVDAVVPRAAIPDYLEAVRGLAAENGAVLAGCGHVGDGNVHLSVFQPNAARRAELLHAIFKTASGLGGSVSGEHGIGSAKQDYFVELENPVKLALLARIKSVFDPRGIMNPGRVLPRSALATPAPSPVTEPLAGHR